MQEDERDLLEVLVFDEIEETVGTWLRAIIQHLEKQQTAIRRHQHKQLARGRETFRGTPFYRKHHPKCAKTGVSDCIGPAAASSSDFGPIRFWQMGVIQRLMRHAEYAAQGIIGSASVAHMFSLWCTRKNTGSCSSCCGLNSPLRLTRSCQQPSGFGALRPLLE